MYSYIEEAFLNFMPARSFIPICEKFEEALQLKLFCPPQTTQPLLANSIFLYLMEIELSLLLISSKPSSGY